MFFLLWFYFLVNFFTLFASRQAKVTENWISIGSWINISSNGKMFSLFPIFEMVDNRVSESLIVK